MKAFIGIDPGMTGAAAILTDDGVSFLDMKNATAAQTVDAFRAWTIEHKIELAVLEQVGAMPGQGVTSMFNFGRSYGWWQGVLDAMGLPWRLVRPQEWQKGLGAAKGKHGLVEVAQRLFPDATFSGPRGGALSGRADAALMAWWARRAA